MGERQTYRSNNATLDSVFYLNSQLGFAHISDGTSQTLLLGERYLDDVYYDERRGSFQPLGTWGRWAPTTGASGIGDVTLGTLVPINYQHPVGRAVTSALEERRVAAMGSGHPGGCNVALGDASTRFVSDDVEAATFHALGTRQGGDIVGGF